MPPGSSLPVCSMAGPVGGGGEEELNLNPGESESMFDRSCHNVIPEPNKL